jgi:signal transduction histidine kinase
LFVEPKDLEDGESLVVDGDDLEPETEARPLHARAERPEEGDSTVVEEGVAVVDDPADSASSARDAAESAPASDARRSSGVGAGFLAIIVLAAAAIAAGAHAAASGLVPIRLDPAWVGPGACAILTVLVSGLFLGRVGVLRRARDAGISAALERLASGSAAPLPEGDPLAPRFIEAAGLIADAARSATAHAEEEARKDSLREIVRVRSQCERLVERYAERLHREKKEALAALDGLRAEHEAERKKWEASRGNVESLRKEADERRASLESRAATLHRDLAARSAESARLSAEVDKLLQEVDRLRQQNVRFFDKVAAQLRGSLQIAGKLAADLSADPPEKSGAKGKGAASAASVEERAAEIRARIAKLERLVEQILDLSRIETSSLSLVYSEADVGVTLKRSCEEVREVAVAKSIDLSFKHPKGMPGVLTDARLLNRIVRELVSNAVRYTPRGGRVTATATISSECPLDRAPRGLEDDWLRVDVTDTGEGIDPKDAERIFTAFERGTEPQFTVSDASPGLGLTLARHYARILGGDILLKSQPGHGSVFSLVLPVKVCVTTHVR